MLDKAKMASRIAAKEGAGLDEESLTRLYERLMGLDIERICDRFRANFRGEALPQTPFAEEVSNA